MCGRYTVYWSEEEFQENFGVSSPPNFTPDYNIAPTRQVVIIRQQENVRKANYARWGLIPGWVKDYKSIKPLFNAKSETIQEKPSFKDSFKKRRCLIPASGFYEWKDKNPHYIKVLNSSVFAFAGLWSHWYYNGETLESCTILTTVPNELISKLHHRMPVILKPEDYALWLDETKNEREELEHLFIPFPTESMSAHSTNQDFSNPTLEHLSSKTITNIP